MDAQYFIDKFTAIPEDRWTTRKFVFRSGTPNECCCALGHCGARAGMPPTPEGKRLADILWKISWGPTAVNDGDDPRYQQPTPKQRILAALRDAKERGL